MEQTTIKFLLSYRYLLAILSIIFTILLAQPIKNLYVEADYKLYFKDNDPRLVAQEEMEDVFISGNNLGLAFEFSGSTIFTESNLAIIYELTDELWQTPYSIRVDSITNFQHTSANGDDLDVEALVYDLEDMSPAKVASVREVSLSEKSLYKRFVSKNEKVGFINVSLELPPDVDKNADPETQKQQQLARDNSHLEVIAFANQLTDDFEQRYPQMKIHLSGVSATNSSFSSSSLNDGQTLIPAMFALIIVLLALILRSIGCIVGTVIVVAVSSVAGIAAGAWFGYLINTVNIMAPVIILIIAVCDCVHLLVIYLRGLSQKLSPYEAMSESIRLNLQPIILTSITTAVGFLTLNFSISPPFAMLGNMTAIGVLWAMIMTFTLLPTITILLVRKRSTRESEDSFFDAFSDFVVRNRKSVFITTSLVAIGLISLIPLNQIDDNPIKYFKQGVPFRDASDFMIENEFGVKEMYFSIDCGEPNCITNVENLKKLQGFDDWLVAQPSVINVTSYIDVIKRLNKSMNGDDEEKYILPTNSDLAAQYNLMYEMSLPYGLDLNNQLNIDKSKTRIQAYVDDITSGDFLDFEERARDWFETNTPELEMQPSSTSLMFAHIGEKNIRSMLVGGVIAILGVTLTILIALRSLRYALISMIPNSFPAFMAFGVWGLLVGQVNMAVAMVFSISLGILVDDTVHFISKYKRAREVKGLLPEDAIKYAFANVGSALVVTTIALVCGFSVLMLSTFNLNAMAGALTALTIAIALIFDFLMLPILLMFFDRDQSNQSINA